MRTAMRIFKHAGLTRLRRGRALLSLVLKGGGVKLPGHLTFLTGAVVSPWKDPGRVRLDEAEALE